MGAEVMVFSCWVNAPQDHQFGLENRPYGAFTAPRWACERRERSCR